MPCHRPEQYQKKKKKEDKGKSTLTNKKSILLSDNIKYFAAIGGGLILAFSETYWLQSTAVEVYSLHLLLINLVVLFMVKAFLYSRQQNGSVNVKSPRNSAMIIFALVDGVVRLNTYKLYQAGSLYNDLMTSCRNILTHEA